MTGRISMLLLCAFALQGGAATDRDALCLRAWTLVMKTWDPKTAVVCGCDSALGLVPDDAKANLYPPLPGRKGGGDFGPVTVGDAALNCGTALCGLVDRWRVTKDPSAASDAEKVARGVLNLAVLHGYQGFVCRGFCADGKTTVSLSSRDQYTHWVHGLWRYVSSGLASPAFVADYRRRIAEVAAFMEARVTEKSGWNFGLADDPSKDPRGICTMWSPKVWPHEAARLPMIYAAAALATGDSHWRELYARYIDKALDVTLEAANPDAKRSLSRMMTYGYYQANASLEVILASERDEARKSRILKAMDMFAQAARQAQERARLHRRINCGMCWEGELLLSQLLSPSFRPDATFDDFLSSALVRLNLENADFCRVAHLTAAYWRRRAHSDEGKTCP